MVTSTLARTADTVLDRLWPGEKPCLSSPTRRWRSPGRLLAGAVAGALLLAMPYPLLVPVASLGLLLFL